jgi:hypothetical protein
MPAAAMSQRPARTTRLPTSPVGIQRTKASFNFGRGSTFSSQATWNLEKLSSIPSDPEMTQTEADALQIDREMEDKLTLLDVCSVKDQQHLQHICTRIQEAIVATRDNVAILRQIKEHYLAVVQLPTFPMAILPRTQESVLCFVKFITSIEENMKRRERQLEQLVGLSQNVRSSVSANQTLKTEPQNHWLTSYSCPFSLLISMTRFNATKSLK